MRWIAAIFTLLTGMAVMTAAQAPAAQRPSFEVASIKLDTSAPRFDGPMLCLVACTPGERMTVDGALVDIHYYSLYRLITAAYRLKPYQMGTLFNPVPQQYRAWINTQHFDIAAKIPEGVSQEKVPEMLQTLLADRFSLAWHWETKETPVYALVVGKNGPKLKPAVAPRSGSDKPDDFPVYTPQGQGRVYQTGLEIPAGPFGPLRSYVDRNGVMHMEFFGITMAQLVQVLPIPDRPVIDRTNLTGSYEFSWQRPTPLAAGTTAEPLDPSLAPREAFDKAGLKLEATTAPLEVMVIDHLEKMPSEN